MQHPFTKSFIKLWVTQMCNNKAFITDTRITSENIGDASTGNLESLREILNVYKDYIDIPQLPTVANAATMDQDEKIRSITLILPFQDRKSSIEEFIQMIDQGLITIL